MTNTMTIDQIIKGFKDIKAQLKEKGVEDAGKLKVFLSSDEEGNSFGSINAQYSFSLEDKTTEGDVVVVYPYEGQVELY